MHLSGFSQNEIKRIKLSTLSLQTGLFVESNTSATIEEFRKMAPASDILKSDLSEFMNSPSNRFYGFVMNSMQAGFLFRDKNNKSYKTNRQLNIGITFLRSSPVSNAYTKLSELRYDTLTSASSGEVVFLDSLITQIYDMNYSSAQGRIDLSYTFNSNAEQRLVLSGGFGITAGFSINSRTNVTYARMARTRQQDQYGNISEELIGDNSFQSENEIINSAKSFASSLYLPLALSFRLGEKDNYWRKMHVFFEVRPGVNFSFIPSIRTIANGCTQAGIGIKWKV
jgi:hypothetical protein